MDHNLLYSDAFWLTLVALLAGAGLASIVFGCRNLKRAGQSPHWMWLSLLYFPFATFIIHAVSIVLVRRHRTRLAILESENQRLAILEAENRQRLAVEQHAAAQRALSLRLRALLSDAIQAAAPLPDLARAADEALDLAEREFEEGAYAPFWEAVEQAARSLANFSWTIQQLKQRAESYRKESERLETASPPFEIGFRKFPDVSKTATRMKVIVRQAQKDFHFATIFEQRKTNQLLVHGFTTLAEAIECLGDRLKRSYDDLLFEINNLSYEFSTGVEEMEMSLTRLSDQTLDDADGRKEHEQLVQKKLDEIQQRVEK